MKVTFTGMGTPEREQVWARKDKIHSDLLASTCPSLSPGVMVWETVVRAGLASGGLPQAPDFLFGQTEAGMEKGLAGRGPARWRCLLLPPLATVR